MSDSCKRLSERTKAESSPNNDRDSVLSVVPVRFDSAPTRIRFDSVPTRIKVSSPKQVETEGNSENEIDTEKKTLAEDNTTTITSSKLDSMHEKADDSLEVEKVSDVPSETQHSDEAQNGTDDKASKIDEVRRKSDDKKLPLITDTNKDDSSPPEEETTIANSPLSNAVESKDSTEIKTDESDSALAAFEEQKPSSEQKSEEEKNPDSEKEVKTAVNHSLEEISDDSGDEKLSDQNDTPEMVSLEQKNSPADAMAEEITMPISQTMPIVAARSPDNNELPVLEKYDAVKVNEDNASGNVEMHDVESPPQITDCEGASMEVEENVSSKEADAPESEKIEEAPDIMEVDAKVDDKKENGDEKPKSENNSDSDSEVTFLAISDVRTINVDDSDNVGGDDSHKEMRRENEENEKTKDDNDVAEDAKNVTPDENSSMGETVENSDDASKVEKCEAAEKGRDIDAIAKKLVKEKSDPEEKKENKTKENSTDSEAEIKSFATDTMNELLGLFGYDKMDDSIKDNLQLKSSISGSSSSEQAGDNSVPSPEKDIELSSDEKKKNQRTNQIPNSSKAVGRLCTECNQVKGCKYQVLMHGNARYLCDDNCFKLFRSRQKLSTTITSTPENRPQTRSVTSPKDYCNVCRKEIKNGQGFLLGVGENKPLCSEECMRKYQTTHAPKRACAQCGNAILGRNKCLTWETMEFCNEECLGKYQSYLGSHCACCNNAVQRTSLGKYCVRFGSDIKQFCSNNCLEEFKKGLKVCSFCLKDISNGVEGFLAPVGDKGQFKDFCSQQCMEKYETMNNNSNSQPSIHQCSVCNKTAAIKVQVMFEGKSHRLCSEPCIAAFRYANKISTSICDTCHKFFDMDGSQPHTIQFEGLSKRFCAKTCMNVFVLSHRKIVPCTWCKVKKYNFDMIERVDSNNHVQLFCSLNCLSLFRVSLNATSSRSVRCDFCQHSRPAQYHLTMSDASIRNFCSYQCVMSFQSQFTNVVPVTPSSPISPNSNTQSNNGTPVISSVVSLAPTQQKGPTTTRQTTSTVTSSSTVTIPATTTTTTTMTTTSSSSSTPASVTSSVSPSLTQVTQQVIIKPPLPKQLKNKALLCKPFLQTKGVSCKPHPCHKTTQTDDYTGKSVPIPIPVPVYVPMPMHMYVSPAPFPLPFPLPIPVPIFIPTSKNTAAGIMKQIKEIQDKIPENPFEAELLMMAEMVAANSESKNDKEESSNSTPGDSATNDAESGGHDGVESQLQDPLHATNAFSDDMLQMALRMATEMDEPAMDLETALASGTPQQQQQQESDYNSLDDNSDILSPRELRARTRSQKRAGGSGRGRGRKKARVDEQAPQTPPGMIQMPETTSVLKFSYGVNAWKHWVLQKNTQLEKASQTNRRLKLFKTDLLQLTADELNYSLCLFVKEVRKPNGEEYAPDSIFYLCLGIQQYLFDNGRIDNIFTDAYYEKFTECLNEVLQKYDASLTADGCMMSRIEEEILWEAKQLGAHSPHVLLNTLMYFNTKFFMLRSVDDHMKLSFSHVMKHWKKSPGVGRGSSNNSARNVLLRYCPPTSQKPEPGRKRKEDQTPYEQLENVDNPLRCPVKLYEFYLSKCPESIKNRSDVFYLYPERSCVPDSPVWYSTMPLGREAVAKMLQRIRMVREVCDMLITTT